MGIPQFFNYIKNKYDKKPYKKCIYDTPAPYKYDYIFLDYQSLFYNVKNLYNEINYLIRLLYKLLDASEKSNPFYTSLFQETNEYLIVKYIISSYKNVFDEIGINTTTCMPTITLPKDQKNENITKIKAILDKFPLSDEILINCIVKDMIEQTYNITRKHLSSSNRKNVYIYFDGIPSIAKVKEQLSRRINGTITAYIKKDILKTTPDTPAIIKEKEIKSKLINTDSISIGVDTPVVNKTRDELIRLGYTVNDNNKYGEAEHQIMKTLSNKSFSRKKILVASPDADLILLSMICNVTNNTNIELYRETVLVENTMDFKYNYDIIKGIVSSPYQREIYYMKINQLKDNMGLTTSQKVLDISYLFLILGDDFVPIIPTLNVDALDKIIETYDDILKTISGFKIIDKTLNHKNFIYFLYKFKDIEATIYISKTTKFNDKVSKRIKDSNKDYTNLQSYLMLDGTNEIIIKKEFYLDKGILLPSNKLLINKLLPLEDYNEDKIKKYLEGCQFIFDLYFLNDIKNYKWFYPYETAPQIFNIITFLTGKKDFSVYFDYINGNNIKTNLTYLDIPSYKKYLTDNKNKILRDIYNRIFPIAPGSSTPVSSTPVSSTPVSSTPVSSTPDSSTPDSSTPDSSTPDSSDKTAIEKAMAALLAWKPKEKVKLSASAREFIPTNSTTISKPLSVEEMEKTFTYANVEKIYECHNQLYFNKCLDYDGNPINPNTDEYNVKIRADLLGGSDYYNKYLKYKNKYLIQKKSLL